MMPPYRVLAVAAATRRIGMVFLDGWELKWWKCTRQATTSPAAAALAMHNWIERYDAKIVVTEKDTESSRKGEYTKVLIAAMRLQAVEDGALSIAVERPRNHKNKYLEAEELVLKYPELRPWLPKREKIYDIEPRYTVIFEALALAEAVKRNGTIGMASAMG